MSQEEWKIVVFNPTMNAETFAADIYFNNKRIECGNGGKTKYEALQEAVEFVRIFNEMKNLRTE